MPFGEQVRVIGRCATAAVLAAQLGACSLSVASLAEDDPAEVTGSIAPAPKKPPQLPSDFDREDVRRAMGALGLALDPQGNGQPVKWDNPESKLSGTMVPTGGPYVESDEICRKFTAHVSRPGGRAARLAGSACRLSGASWQIRSLSTAKPG